MKIKPLWQRLNSDWVLVVIGTVAVIVAYTFF
jgi:hypothetical protein